MNSRSPGPGGGFRGFVRDVAELLSEIAHGPRPYPVLYLRCDACGEVAPRLIVRRQGTFTISDDGTEGYATPNEYQCPLCGVWTPRVLGDQVDPDNPATDTVLITCEHRLWAGYLWRRCRTTFRAPSQAAIIRCPACGHESGPDNEAV